MDDRLLTSAEAADYLQVSMRELRRRIKSDGLPYVDMGRRCIRYRREDLARWVEERVHLVPVSGAASQRTVPKSLSQQEQEILLRLRRPRIVK